MDAFALLVPQVLLARDGGGSIRWLAESPDLPADLRSQLEAIAQRFGPRPPGVRCPEAQFVLPERNGAVFLGRVTDLDATSPSPSLLGFHILLLNRAIYEAANAEAFAILAQQPSPWERRGSLPLASIPPAPGLREVGELEQVLKRPDGPLLLGSCQALLDGSRLAFRREQPAQDEFTALWKLLPYRSAVEFRAATYAFSNDLDLHLLAAPDPRGFDLDYRYLSEAQAENYPEGRYELALQVAVEAGDQAAARRLLLRRTRKDTLRMGLWLLGGMVLASLVFGMLKAAR